MYDKYKKPSTLDLDGLFTGEQCQDYQNPVPAASGGQVSFKK